MAAPAASDVRLGVVYDDTNAPAVGDVRFGVTYTTSFDPSSLSGLTHQWAFDEGSGLGVINKAATVPTTSFPNMIGAPEQFFAATNAGGGWEDMFGGATVTNAAAANPNNAETTASRLVLSATGNKGIRYIPGGNLLASGVTYTLSCYVKSNSGSTETVRLFYGNGPTNSSDQTVAVADGWKRLTFTFTTAATGLYVGIRNGSGAGAVDVLIWGATLHVGSSDLGYTNAQGDLLFLGGSSNPTWVAGRGITFPGAGQYLLCPLGASVTLNGVSVYAVVRRHASVTDNQRWYGALLSTFGVSFSAQTLGLGAGGMISQSVYRGGPSFSYGATSTSSVVAASAGEGVLTGADHCICATHDGTTLRILIDGHLLAESAAFARSAQAVTRMLVGYVQGAGGGTAGGCYKGDILYMTVYNQGHTVAQARTGMAGLLSLCATRTSYSAPPTDKIVIYEGDSLTTAAGLDPAYGWTRNCTEAALASVGVQARSFAVVGSHSGPYPESPGDTNTVQNRLATDLSTMMTAAVTRCVVVSLPGFTNDMTDTTAATSIANWRADGDIVRAAGAKFVVVPAPPKLNTEPTNTKRATINADATNVANIGVHCDAIADITADAVLALNSSATNLTYYNVDAIHLTQAGYDRFETYVSAAVTGQL